MATFSVVVGDVVPLIREGLRHILEQCAGVELVGEASNGDELEKLVRALKPDLVVFDVDMPECGALRTTQLVGENPGTRAVVLTMRGSAELAQQLVAAGVAGYILKTADAGYLRDALIGVMVGNVIVNHRVHAMVTRRPPGTLARDGDAKWAAQKRLSERDMQLLRWLSEDLTNAEIGRRLTVSARTAKAYISALFDELGVRSRMAAVVFAIRSGMLEVK